MNAKEQRELLYFPEGLDAAVNEKFKDAKCETKYNFLLDQHVTNYNSKIKGERKKEINAFISGFMAGNEELRERLSNLKKKGAKG